MSVGKKGDNTMSTGGVPPCGEEIVWALKGLKVSGVPSPPQTDCLGLPARRTGKNEEAGSRGVVRLGARCWH